MPEKAVLYELIVETASEGIWIKNADHITTFVNEKMATILGYSIDELMGKRFEEFVHPDDIPEMEKRHKERLEGNTSGYEIRLIKNDGSTIWTNINGSPLMNEGEFIGSLGMVADITQLKQREFQREENERRYRSLFEDSPVPTWEEDFSEVKNYLDQLKSKGIRDIRAYFESNQLALIACARLMRVTDVNDAVLNLNKAPDKEFMIKNYRSLASRRSAEYAIRQFEAIANGDKSCEFDAELSTFENTTIHVHLKWTVVKGYEDSYGKVYLTTTDVTDRILAENERLRNSNLQKELLLKEIHHRVKNNLQIITSLLRLQSNSIDDEKIKSLFDVSLNRINSMALVHDLLYKAEDLSKINFGVYIEKLLESLVESLVRPDFEINTEVDIDAVEFNISTSILLGLLVNELMTNSIKHAFNGADRGRIYIRLIAEPGEFYLLEIGDDGSGFDLEEDFELLDSLGLQLIHNLVDQLNGKIEKMEERDGAHFHIRFRELLPESVEA